MCIVLVHLMVRVVHESEWLKYKSESIDCVLNNSGSIDLADGITCTSTFKSGCGCSQSALRFYLKEHESTY